MNPRNYKDPMPQHATWCEIDLGAVRYNLRQVKKLAARNEFLIPSRGGDKKIKTSLMGVLCVIKADAYGHGMLEVSRIFDDEGVEMFGVSDINEGIALRDRGIKRPILLFESTLPEHIPFICEYNLTPTLCTLDFARRLDALARKLNKTIRVHIEIDTGMGRLGVWHTGALEYIAAVGQLRNLVIEGIFTHFPSADSDKKFTEHQIALMYNIILELDKTGLIIPYVHACNSMGLMGYHTSVLNLFRPGLMVYGQYPHKRVREVIDLRPALTVKSKVIFVKDIAPGRSISYGRTFIAKKTMTVATIPIGYNDGYLREFSNKGHVLIHGQRCKVLGMVTMDQIVVDVSKVPDVTEGTVATVLGTNLTQTITADELAKHAKTINYEILCHLGNRLPRVYVGE
ncbi:MAG: alanine racemase [Candidatus Omnitrophica bacterium]|nr:alanine racemase [Candidatus Omnitrophota bacterium]